MKFHNKNDLITMPTRLYSTKVSVHNNVNKLL